MPWLIIFTKVEIELGGIFVDKNIYTSKPNGARPQNELEIYELMDKLNIEYLRVDHEPAMTIADCAEIDALLGVPMCKNLFLCDQGRTRFYLLMMPGGKPFKTKELSAQLGIPRLSFADAEYMLRFLNITPGSLSVLGLAWDTGHNVRLLVDAEVARGEFIGCHPCVNTASLRVKTSDLTDVFIKHTGHDITYVEL